MLEDRAPWKTQTADWEEMKQRSRSKKIVKGGARSCCGKEGARESRSALAFQGRLWCQLSLPAPVLTENQGKVSG